MSKRSRPTTWFIASAIFALAWWLRARGANAFITWDEPAWTYRSARFLLALGDGRLYDTLQVGHPGVLTMWSGALGLLWHRLVSGQVTADQLQAVQALAELDIHDATTLRMLGELLPYAKSGILLLYSLLTAATYLLLDRLLPRGAALLASLLLLLEPYNLALTRVLHIDGLTATLMLVSTLAALVWARDQRTLWLVASGATLGLAVLTKSYAVMGAPVAIALFVLAPGADTKAHRAHATFSALWRWGLAALATFVLLWPAMWVSPKHVVETVFELSFGYATAPGDATTSFFMGELTDQIGWTFYPVVLFMRTTPTTLVGLAFALASMMAQLRRPRNQRALHFPLAMSALAICYLALISLGAKKYDRYVLPALVALDLLAAWGFLALWRWLAPRVAAKHKRIIMPIAIALVVATCGLWLAPYFPSHSLAHYNALIGGPTGAADFLPLGWGEGVEMAAKHLAAQPDADTLHVASWAVAGLAPKLAGTVTTPEHAQLPDADYVLFTIGDVQNGNALAIRYFEEAAPDFVAKINGQPYAWVYANDYAVVLAKELGAEIASDDMVITALPSTLERHHGDALPLVRIDPASEEATVKALRTAGWLHGVRDGSRIYRIRWIDDARADPLQWQIEQTAILVHSQEIPFGTLETYVMRDNPDAFRMIHVEDDAHRPTIAAEFGPILLEDANVYSPAVYKGQRIGVALRWHTLASLDEDYHLFLHLLDDQGHKWGQRDLALANEAGARSASWPLATTQTSRATVPLAPGIVPGQYRLVAGVYRWQDGAAIGPPATLAQIGILASGQPGTVDLATLGIDTSQAVEMVPGIELLDHRLSTESARTGEQIELWLTWRCTEETERDWRLQVSLASESHRVDSGLHPAGPTYPTNRWGAGEVLVYPADLRLDGNLLPTGHYAVSATMYQASGGAQGVTVDLGDLAIENVIRQYEVPRTAEPTDIHFGQTIALAGYHVQSQPPGGTNDTVHAILYWRALAEMDQDWTVFVHVLDEQGTLWGQVDTQPAEGTRKTSGWIQDEIVTDAITVSLPDTAPAGRYRVAVGLYDATTGRRAEAIDAAGAPVPDNRLILPMAVDVKK